MKTKQENHPPQTGNQIVEKKIQAANAYLKNADLSLVYEAMGKKES